MFHLKVHKSPESVFFIAEIGKNFIATQNEMNVAEYLENAKKLVDAAVGAGADAVKFQTHQVEDEVMDVDFTSPHFSGKNRYAWVMQNTLATPLDTFWTPLSNYCREKGIIFFSTPMSRGAAQKLMHIDPPFWKVGSGDVQDYVLLDYLKSTKKPIIISTGMVSYAELDEVVTYLQNGNDAPIAILYCISKYPCPTELFNLSSISVITQKYPSITVGFSDHSLSHDATFAAIQVGAKIIEKHFSFSRDLWGADHKVSLNPLEFKEMVDGYKSGRYESVDYRQFYGDPAIELEGKNNQFRDYFNKALVFAQDLEAGTVIDKEMLYALRPIKLIAGLKSDRVHEILGKKIVHNVTKFQPVTLEVCESKVTTI